MKCCAMDCENTAISNDICCDKHAAIAVKFRAAFGRGQVAHSVLNHDFHAEQTLILPTWKNLSTEVELAHGAS